MTRLPEPITDPNVLQYPRIRRFIKSWPLRWRLISMINQCLPKSGRLRKTFEDRIFAHPWARWHRFAYIPEYRDTFFEYILTFFYQYPIRKGDVVVQIGASGGEETIRFARSVGETGRVIAIEPAPFNVQRLKETFTPDEFPQVTIVPKAAANTKGKLRFFLGLEKEGRLAEIPANELTYEWWGVQDHLNEPRYQGETLVEADTPDKLLAPFGVTHIDFILVETNGTELEVVQAMDKILPITRRIGARGHVMRDGVPIYHAIEAQLKAKGFETSVTDEGMVLANSGKIAGE
jgi:FkbM family methyltransferase